jgi:hypothetical protein
MACFTVTNGTLSFALVGQVEFCLDSLQSSGTLGPERNLNLEEFLGPPLLSNILKAMEHEHEKDKHFDRKTGKAIPFGKVLAGSIDREHVIDPRSEWGIATKSRPGGPLNRASNREVIYH